MADKATWPEIQEMSLDEVDLQLLMLEAIEYREKVDEGEPSL